MNLKKVLPKHFCFLSFWHKKWYFLFLHEHSDEWLKEDKEMVSWLLQQKNESKECQSKTILKREKSPFQSAAKTRMETNKNIFQ